MKRIEFTEEMDLNLASLVMQYNGKGVDWIEIARRMAPLTPRQCKERWINYLCPIKKKRKWTKEENDILISKFNELGENWAKISTFFTDRDQISVKNQWNYLQRTSQNTKNNPPALTGDLDIDTRGFEGILDLFDVIPSL